MSPLILSDFGLYLGKHSERLVVKKGREEVSEHPLLHVEQVLIAGRGISVSSDALAACVERGIPVTLLDFSGKPYAQVVSPALTATVKTRREQLLAYYDDRGLQAACRFAEGKLHNQMNLLKYFAKYRKRARPAVFAELERIGREIGALAGELAAIASSPTRPPANPSPPPPAVAPIDLHRDRILNLEGRAGALYWQGVQKLLPPGLFETREHRGAQDEVNTLLNYGYGILYSQVWTALTLAGLEPFGGFLHVDRPGKPSLVLDFIEEFRPPIVDRTVIALLNKGFEVEWELPNEAELKEQHQASKPTESQEQAVAEQRRLSAATRKAFAEKVLARLEDEEPYEGKRHKLRNILQMQARHLATFLRGERKYQAFVMRW